MNRNLRLIDSEVFGDGRHPTTALCLGAFAEEFTPLVPDRLLDVGTGSGILALTALMMGVRQAVGLDIDANAVNVAAENARLNNLSDRVQFVLGGPDAVDGVWPFVVANILAAPLIDLAPIMVRRVGNRGRLVLSGIATSLEVEVRQAYQQLGMHYVRSEERAGWAALVLQASW